MTPRPFESVVAPDLAADRPAPVPWEQYSDWLTGAWVQLLASEPDEPAVQEFLEAHPCLLPGAREAPSSVRGAHRGHHDPCWHGVIRQPELKGLGRTRYPDFMWIRRDTASVRPVLIEIEDPKKPWFTKSRLPHAKLTQALDQLVEWRVWFARPENQLVFMQRYVPPMFHDRDLEPEFVLIYGRDAEFRAGTSRHRDVSIVRRKRDYMRRRHEFFLTFDMLMPEPLADTWATLTFAADGMEVANVPPTFTTGPESRELAAAISDIDAALRKAALMTEERKQYLANRWRHWRNLALPDGFWTQRGFGE